MAVRVAQDRLCAQDYLKPGRGDSAASRADSDVRRLNRWRNARDKSQDSREDFVQETRKTVEMLYTFMLSGCMNYLYVIENIDQEKMAYVVLVFAASHGVLMIILARKKLIRMAGAAALLTAFAMIAAPAMANPVCYPKSQGGGDVCFANGAQSFADSVYNFKAGSNTLAPYNDPTHALGAPDYDGTPAHGNFVSLGQGGMLDLLFSDNSLTTSGNSDDDLYIFEVGPRVEGMNVYISQDAMNWVSVGSVGGATAGVDIDAFIGTGSDDVTAGARYSYVRLVDGGGNGYATPYAGPDIDAVGAISSSTPVGVPEPATLGIFGLGTLLIGLFAGFRRRRI